MTLLEQLQAAAENARKGLPAALTIIATAVSIPLSLKFYRENR